MTASSPSHSPVTITVSSSGKGAGARRLSLTSPVRRTSLSNNPSSPLSGRANANVASSGGRYRSTTKDETEDVSSEFVAYTVHIPPTPDHQPMSQQSGLPDDLKAGELKQQGSSFISGTIFTGGFNSVTRGHVVDGSQERAQMAKSTGRMVCGMMGCDEKAAKGKAGPPCECGFKICRDCYSECLQSGGRCPGCKDKYREDADEEEEWYVDSEADDMAGPLPSMADYKPDKRLSVVKSLKVPHYQQDFDHSSWLFETKGTYGYGNALWPKDGYSNGGYEEPPNFGERSRRPLTRKVNVSPAILSPYRYKTSLPFLFNNTSH